MAETLQAATAAAYLLAGALAAVGLVLRRAAWTRAAVWTLAAGALVHGASFTLLHRLDPPPPLTHLPSAISFMAWVATVGFLLLSWRQTLASLVVWVAPLAFLGVFIASLGGVSPGAAAELGSGSLPHAHVLLASGGLALLGLAGLAGLLFLVEHRRLKRKRAPRMPWPLPSLEALDRAGALAVAVGFPLLTLGVVSGSLWIYASSGVPFTGGAHQSFSLVAWAVYGVLVAMRFGLGQPARRCALSSVAGFGLLGLAVLGVGLWT